MLNLCFSFDNAQRTSLACQPRWTKSPKEILTPLLRDKEVKVNVILTFEKPAITEHCVRSMQRSEFHSRSSLIFSGSFSADKVVHSTRITFTFSRSDVDILASIIHIPLSNCRQYFAQSSSACRSSCIKAIPNAAYVAYDA